MPRHLHRRRRDDAGMAWFLELLLILATMAVIVGMVGNSVVGSMQNNRDLNVQQDLRNYAKAAEAYFVRQSAYPTLPTGWNMRGRDPASEHGTYRVDVHPSGPDAGYVIWGRDTESTSWTFVLSSYTDGEPTRVEDATPAMPEGVGDPVTLEW